MPTNRRLLTLDGMDELVAVPRCIPHSWPKRETSAPPDERSRRA
jgi:hypothetical protein